MEKHKTNSQKQLDFQDLMLFRVHEILLVASDYDAFILEEDGRLTEQILHEYLGMNLGYAPRVWKTNTAQSALQMLEKEKLNIVIVMMRLADTDIVSFCKDVKKKYPRKPIILLAFDESELTDLPENFVHQYIESVFIWTGNSNVFPAIVKQFEDRKNAKRDILNGDVRAIIFIEDTPRYYSVILPLIYQEITYHTKQLVNKSLNDPQRLLHSRGRPKILLATDYEKAKYYFNKYQSNILGIISDIRFPRKGKLDPTAGITFSKYIRDKEPYIPIILQSSDLNRKKEAEYFNTLFLHKLSDTLLLDIRKFILKNFGFGDFIFRNKQGRQITKANSLKSLVNRIKRVPQYTILKHARSNHFSNWLAARGEFELAKLFRPLLVRDFSSTEDLRKYLIAQISKTVENKVESRFSDFNRPSSLPQTNFTRISEGSLGGKARGLAFLQTLITQYNLSDKFPHIDIRIPKVFVIGTDEFDCYMKDNNLYEKVSTAKSNKEIKSFFLSAKLSKNLTTLLKSFISQVHYPLAVRSSSILEDSQYQPLAGLYATFMLPNAHYKDEQRLNQLIKAIKLVFASTFYSGPKSIMDMTSRRPDEEKMAVLIMELVGEQYDNRFYPTFSGTAQSINYYPVSYMKRDEGVATVALGFGRTVMEGKKAVRFSPKYPHIIPQFFSVKATFDSSQLSFYALDIDDSIDPLQKGEKGNLSTYSLDVAEHDGTLKHLGSVISAEDDIIRDSLSYPGARVVTFTPLLKWNTICLPEIMTTLLSLGKNALGTPIELEFAVNIPADKKLKPEFCLLQIRPMGIIGQEIQSTDELFLEQTDTICRSSVALGNGIIDGICDIIFVDPKTFDASKTIEIAQEIGLLNSLINKGTRYLLVGPGRWGTADPLLGIPTTWQQISKAGVIAEIGLDSFPVDPSFGSHFFQNITSLRIGYFTINHKQISDMIDIDWIESLTLKKKMEFSSWYHLDYPLNIQINGISGVGVISKPTLPKKDIMDEQESSGI